MSCEHRFVPFPDSLAKLYCQRCGEGKDAFARLESTRESRPPRRARTTTPRAAEAPTLFDRVDPDRDAAAEILARKNLEKAVREIVVAANVPFDEADQLVDEAVNFGEDLDLDRFAEIVQARADRSEPRYAPAEHPLDG